LAGKGGKQTKALRISIVVLDLEAQRGAKLQPRLGSPPGHRALQVMQRHRSAPLPDAASLGGGSLRSLLQQLCRIHGGPVRGTLRGCTEQNAVGYSAILYM
jgi:hypothetical protein